MAKNMLKLWFSRMKPKLDPHWFREQQEGMRKEIETLIRFRVVVVTICNGG